MLAALAVTDKVAGRSAIVMMGATTGEGAAPVGRPFPTPGPRSEQSAADPGPSRVPLLVPFVDRLTISGSRAGKLASTRKTSRASVSGHRAKITEDAVLKRQCEAYQSTPPTRLTILGSA